MPAVTGLRFEGMHGSAGLGRCGAAAGLLRRRWPAWVVLGGRPPGRLLTPWLPASVPMRSTGTLRSCTCRPRKASS